MRKLGWILLAIGLLITLFACVMDTSVPSGISGERVHNIGLMRDQSNGIMIGIAILIAGIVIIGFSQKEHIDLKSGVPDRNKGAADKLENWSKARDLSDNGYKLYLSKKFKIEKNSVFDKFILAEEMYSDLDEALNAAHLKDQNAESSANEQLKTSGATSTSSLNQHSNSEHLTKNPKLVVYSSAIIIISIALFGLNVAFDKQENNGVPAPRNYKAEAEYQEMKKRQMEETKVRCVTNKKEIEKDYLSLAQKGDWWKAGLKVWNCTEATSDPDFIRWGNEATTMDNKRRQ